MTRFGKATDAGPRDAAVRDATADASPEGGAANQVVGAALRRSAQGNTTPIFLFGDGWACTDSGLLQQPDRAPMHRAANPSDWVRWRIEGDQVELQSTAGWTSAGKAIAPQATGDTLNLRLTWGDGLDLGSGVVITRRRYIFNGNGSYDECEVITVSGSGATSRSPTKNRGTYTLDGFSLVLQDGKGMVESYAFVWDPDKARAWINRRVYEEEEEEKISLTEYFNNTLNGDPSVCTF